MSFLNPAVLWALPAVGLPVAIHLINKFRVREMRWAAMRFLSDSLRVNQRRLRLEDFLLLVLRCFLVVVAVLAFAQPVLRSVLPGGSGASGPVAAMILLDNSASMGQTNGVVSRFEQAKSAIRDRVERAEQNSIFGLLLVSDETEALLAKPTPDLARFRHSLDLAQLSDRGSDLSAGIRAAYAALQALPGRSREIDVYTDGQAGAWSRLDEIRRLQAANPGVRLQPLVLGKRGEDNLGVTALAPAGGALAVNQPCRFQVEIGNYGAQPVEGVRVTVAVDGLPPSDEALIPRIEAGATQTAGLLVRFSDAGDHAVTAAIPADRLAADNQRTVAVHIANRLNALVLEGGNAPAPMDRDGFFLANALVPYAREQAEHAYLSVTLGPASGLSAAALAANDLVCLCNPGVLPADSGRDLRAYVLGGGNLVIFPGPLTDPVRWRDDPAMWSLLPAVMGPAKIPGAATPILHWQTSKFEHPVTALWNDPEQGNLGTVQVTGYFPLAPRAANENPEPGDKHAPAVIVRYTNGDPAAVEWSCGRGSVVLFGSAASPPWTDLPLHPAFVALVQRLLGYLTRRHSAPLSLEPGTTFQTTVPIELLGKEFSVLPPGKDARKRVAGQVELDGDQAVIRYGETDALGAYRLYCGPADIPLAVFAVQLDPAESDLRQIDPRELATLARDPEQKTASGPGAAAAPRLTVTKEFWTTLVWLGAAMAIVELVLAQHVSRSR